MLEGTEVTDEAKTEPVVVSREVPQALDEVWKVLLTDEGQAALLGPGGRLGDKGHTWQADDGTHGVTRSFHPLEQIRFSWHRDADAAPTLVDLRLSRAGEGTGLEIVHDHLAGDVDRAWLTDHWTKALARIADDAL